MIQFEITQSPDENVKSSFKYFKNEVYIGSNALDLAIADSELINSHLLIEVPEKDLLVHPQKGVEFFLINGKRATSIKRIKTGDCITVGGTTIRILAFEHTVTLAKKDILDKKFAELLETQSARLPTIEMITKLMK